MPLLAAPDPPVVVPWSWTVTQLGPLLTESMRQTLLARFRKLGFTVTTWAQYRDSPPWTWSVPALGAQLTEAQRQTLLARLRSQGVIPKSVTTWLS